MGMGRGGAGERSQAGLQVHITAALWDTTSEQDAVA